MQLLLNIKYFVQNYSEKIKMHLIRGLEIKKFKDPRRVKIYSEIVLSNEQKNAIDKLYLENYGKKIPYTWHRHFTAFTGKFDEKYIPELLYYPEFERFQNMYKEYVASLEDKNFLPLIAKGAGVKTVDIIVSRTKGVYRNSEFAIIDKDEAVKIISCDGDYFCKPSIDTSSGVGCFAMKVKNGIDTISNRPVVKIFDDLGKDFCIQKRIICHSSIQRVYPDGVNTFRVFTYRWKDKIEHFPSIMRIGRNGSVLDNAHAGGIFIGVQDDGQLQKSAFTEFRDEYIVHPNTQVKFAEVKFELFPKVLEAAEKMHQAIPQIGSFNWDFTIDQDGNPLLIEANVVGGSIWLTEMANGCGAFGDKTPEVLRWLRLMKRTKVNERYKYNFGYNDQDYN